MDRFIWTHPTTEPNASHPVDPAQVAAYGPAPDWAQGPGWDVYPPARVYPPVPAELAAYSAKIHKVTPHGTHLILTLITCGLWSPMWIGHAIWNHMTRKTIKGVR